MRIQYLSLAIESPNINNAETKTYNISDIRFSFQLYFEQQCYNTRRLRSLMVKQCQSFLFNMIYCTNIFMWWRPKMNSRLRRINLFLKNILLNKLKKSIIILSQYMEKPAPEGRFKLTITTTLYMYVKTGTSGLKI